MSLGGNEAWLDRDFILNIVSAEGNRDAGWQEPDREHHVALASFSPVIPGQEIASACIKVVVDCSGSMAGDSIEQARVGLLRILDNLRETDTFNIVRFGNTALACFPTCVPATSRALRQARQAVEKMQADLGGTAMDVALELAYALEGDGEHTASILLITDGEISNHANIISRAATSGHRVFTVGVGSAVAEGFVRGIAQRTGGAAELVSPNEGMAATIYRQFRRMLQPRAVSAQIQWPTEPAWQSPGTLGAVFSGDTLHVFAGFAQPIVGVASLLLTLEDGSEVRQQVALPTGEAANLGRIASAHRIEQMDSGQKDQATALAVDYQLISRYTNYLIVEVREAAIQPDGLPVIAQVPQMMAAGYGGTGRLQASRSRASHYPDAAPVALHSNRRADVYASKSTGMDEFDIPAFLRKQADSPSPQSSASSVMKSVIKNVLDSIDETIFTRPQEPAKAMIAVIDAKDWYQAYVKNVRPSLPSELLEVLDALVDREGWEARQVASALLLTMLDLLDGAVSRHDKRGLLFDLKHENPPQRLIELFEAGLELNDDGWGWNATTCELLPLVS